MKNHYWRDVSADRGELVEARQITDRNIEELAEWCGGRAYALPNNDTAYLKLEGPLPEVPFYAGDWVAYDGVDFRLVKRSEFASEYRFIGAS